MFLNEKENNDVKLIIPSSIANHIAIAISVQNQIIPIRYFLKILQPWQLHAASLSHVVVLVCDYRTDQSLFHSLFEKSREAS